MTSAANRRVGDAGMRCMCFHAKRRKNFLGNLQLPADDLLPSPHLGINVRRSRRAVATACALPFRHRQHLTEGYPDLLNKRSRTVRLRASRATRSPAPPVALGLQPLGHDRERSGYRGPMRCWEVVQLGSSASTSCLVIILRIVAERTYAPEREHIACSRAIGQPTDGGPSRLSWVWRGGLGLGSSCCKPGARQ